MDKKGFLEALRQQLSGLPQSDIEERLAFYAEMIDDRTEEGMSEEEAVAEIGSAEAIAREIVTDTPLRSLVKEKVRSKRKLGARTVILLAVGSPLWLSLLIVAAAVILSVYVSLWAIALILWATGGALVGSAVGGALAIVPLALNGSLWVGLLLLGAGLFLGGLSILWFFGCGKLSKGLVWLTKRMMGGVKLLFVRRREEA